MATKARVTVTIDAALLEMVKERTDNVSTFVERAVRKEIADSLLEEGLKRRRSATGE